MSRTGHARYRRNRKRILDQDVCWICGQWINPELKAPHPGSWTADHVEPIYQGGSNNGLLKPAHRRCNIRRGNMKQPQPVQHGRRW